MKKHFAAYTTIRLILAAVLLSVCSSSCDTSGPREPSGRQATNVYLSLFLAGSGSSARSRDIGTWDTPDVSAFESVISRSDLRIYLFDRSGSLVTELDPAGLNSAVSDESGIRYALTTSFPAGLLPMLAVPGSDRTIAFRLAIAANLSAAGGSYPRVAEGYSYADLDPTFSLPADFHPSSYAGPPMYGVIETTIDRSGLESTSGTKPMELGEITLMRSLCRIDLADAIANKFKATDGETYPHIDRVEISGYTNTGYLRFDPSLDDRYTDNGAIVSARILDNGTGMTKSFMKTDAGQYRAYVPEGKLRNAVLSVWATRQPGDESMEFTFDMARSTSFGTDEFIRNHVYSLEVTAIGPTAEISTGVKPWVSHDTKLDYASQSTMSRFLTWNISEADRGIRIEEGSESQKPVLHIYDNGNTPIAGEFEISAPAGAEWSAWFLPGINGVGAFEFLTTDEHGELTVSRSVVSGEVGKRSAIHIRGVGATPLADNHAELVIMVRSEDSATMYAPLDRYGNTRFGLIRHKSLFD